MDIKIIQITSSNHRPADHEDFKGDIQINDRQPDNDEIWKWIRLYVEQGDRVIIERLMK